MFFKQRASVIAHGYHPQFRVELCSCSKDYGLYWDIYDPGKSLVYDVTYTNAIDIDDDELLCLQ